MRMHRDRLEPFWLSLSLLFSVKHSCSPEAQGWGLYHAVGLSLMANRAMSFLLPVQYSSTPLVWRGIMFLIVLLHNLCLFRAPASGTRLASSPAPWCWCREVCWALVWTCAPVNCPPTQPGQADRSPCEPSPSEWRRVEGQQWKGKGLRQVWPGFLFSWLFSA